MSVINLSVQNAIKDEVIKNQSQTASFQHSAQKQMLSEYDYNLYDRNGEIEGYRLDTSGLVEAASACTSAYIRIDRNVFPKLKFLLFTSGTTYNTILPRLYFYDKDYSVIYSKYSQDISVDIDIPDGACYFRISYTVGSLFGDTLTRVIVVKYACFSVSINDDIKKYTYYEQADGNIFSRANIVYGRVISYSNETMEINSATNGAFSGFIPVLPNTKYYAHLSNSNGYYNYIFLFDHKKNFISYLDRRRGVAGIGVIKIPSNCYYVGFNVITGDGVDIFAQTDFCGLIPVKDDSEIVGKSISRDNKVVAYHTSTNVLPFGRVIVLGVYENHVAYKNYADDPNIHYSSTGWTGDFTDISVSTTFGGATHVEKVLFFKHAVSGGVFDVRAIVFTNDNRIYGTTDATFTTFQECNVWDVKGNKYWNADDNDKDPEGVRYRFHFPADVSTRQNAFLWHNGPVWIEGQGGQFGSGVVFGNYSDGDRNDKNAGAQLYYTEDGINIYVQYQFGINQKFYKTAGDETVKTNNASGNTGDDLDTTSFTGSSTSLSLRVRYNIVPSEGDADPTNKFEYLEPVTISSISGKNFTLTDTGGINVGDIVVFGGTATGDYAKILNNNATTTDGGSCCFVIKSISGNVITLADAIGNPKNNLMCRHIHGVSHFGQGIAFYTGEEYPCSWMIYLMPYTRNVSHNENNNLWVSSIVNMTSSPKAFQRALGLFLRPDGNILFIADSPDPYAKKLTISGKDIIMSNYGLFKIAPEGLNDSSKAQSMLTAVDAIYALYFISGILFVSDYHGKTYYSTDNGDTWNYICEDGLTKNDILGFDKNAKRFYFNGFIIETL